MARNGFLYDGADPDNSSNYKSFEVKGLPVVATFIGSGCAQLQVAVGWAGSGECCEPEEVARWVDYVIDCDGVILSECNVQAFIKVPGLYRFDISNADASTVIHFIESEPLVVF